MHLLLYYLSLVSMQYTEEVSGRVFWIQTDSELVVPYVLQSHGKLKDLVSILNCTWWFVGKVLFRY